MIDKDKILEIIKIKGPFIPRDLVKEIGGDTFLTGAILSQLVDTKQLKLTSAKIGGSPLYYVLGQEEKLERLYKYLNEKDKRAYDLLKEKKIVRDNECEPLLRVALRSIKDFSKPLEVTINQNKEIFWKWHLVSNQEAEEAIRTVISPKTEKKEPEVQKKTEEKIEEKNTAVKPEEKEILPIVKTPDVTEKHEEKKTRKAKEIKEPRIESHQEKLSLEINDTFYEKVKKSFAEKGIVIIDANVIKKNSDIELNIEIPSVAGKIFFFSKAKDKKKTSEKDLGMLFVEAQLKKMPVLYVTTGEMTKKAEQMLKTEFKIISVLKI